MKIPKPVKASALAVYYFFAVVGVIDFSVQMATHREVRVIHSTLTAIFGAHQ